MPQPQPETRSPGVQKLVLQPARPPPAVLSSPTFLPQDLLTTVLSYHVIPGVAVEAAALEEGQILQTILEGAAGQLKVRWAWPVGRLARPRPRRSILPQPNARPPAAVTLRLPHSTCPCLASPTAASSCAVPAACMPS